MIDIHEIVNKTRQYLPRCDTDRILRAYYFAEKAHEGQTRFSGEPYIHHPLSVTDILLDFHPDEDTIVAALLHDVAEDTPFTLDDISAQFGSEVRELCDGMMKLSKVRTKLDDPATENLRKLFLAMAKDLRVVLLKLCDRLHNMRTLQFVRPEKQRRIAQETLNIYGQIAGRLGMYRIKSELDDLCFEHLDPSAYGAIHKQLVKTKKWRDQYIEFANKILSEILNKEGMSVLIEGRVKGIYSIHRKLVKKNKSSLDEIFDVFAMRVILPDMNRYDTEYTGHLYTALGVIHKHFTPLANRFKDYVAVPKVNGYRSLHTTVMGLGPKEYAQPTEIQLRTNLMHNESEYGVASHWIYEASFENRGVDEEVVNLGATRNITTGVPKRHQDWLAGLELINNEISGNQELLENLSVDMFQDRIFVLTPRGDVKDLPLGATPVDFAYSLHTEVGNRCFAAKVNGNIVPLDFRLKSGEVVEIVTRKNAVPHQQWLSFAKTNQARNRIRAWFRNMDEEKHLRSGRQLLNEKLQQFGLAPLDVSLSILKHYDGKNVTMIHRREVLVDIGKGSLLASTVLRKIFPTDELLQNRVHTKIERGGKKELLAHPTPELIIGGDNNVPFQFVRCCNATLQDQLIGYITRTRGVSVHKKDCVVAQKMGPQRLIEVRSSNPGTRYPIHVKIIADDRMSLIRDISGTISESSINILDFFQDPPTGGKVEFNFILDIVQFEQLDRLLSQLEKIPSVRRAVKVS